MILTDLELEAEIRANRLIFEPRLITEGPGKQIQICTIDLRLGYTFRYPRDSTPVDGVEVKVDSSAANFDIRRFLTSFTDEIVCKDDQVFELRPYTPVLAMTLERVALPGHLCAMVEGRSSLARMGLTVHNTAPFVHPGYNDTITLELYHRGPFTLMLRPGELRICQLIVMRLTPPSELYPGPYSPGVLAS